MTPRNDHIPEGFQDLLQSTAVARVATIGPEGGSQNNSARFDREGEYGLLVQRRQKLRRDAKIALSTVDPENDRPGDERVVPVRPQHTTHKDG